MAVTSCTYTWHKSAGGDHSVGPTQRGLASHTRYFNSCYCNITPSS